MKRGGREIDENTERGLSRVHKPPGAFSHCRSSTLRSSDPTASQSLHWITWRLNAVWQSGEESLKPAERGAEREGERGRRVCVETLHPSQCGFQTNSDTCEPLQGLLFIITFAAVGVLLVITAKRSQYNQHYRWMSESATMCHDLLLSVSGDALPLTAGTGSAGERSGCTCYHSALWGVACECFFFF